MTSLLPPPKNKTAAGKSRRFLQKTSRLFVLALLGAAFSTANLHAKDEPKTPPANWAISPETQKTLEAMFDREDSKYDPQERMLAGYRTASTTLGHSAITGKVHDVRGSLFYGTALLSSVKPERQQRGLQIIERILEIQDTDPNSRSFGVWSYSLEEPLQKMNFVDYNWADFIGSELVMALARHPELFSPELKEKVKTAIINAAAAIQKRNVTVSYTNITVLGTLETLAAAEMFDLPDLKKYGMDRLKRFYDYTKAEGGFWEYNSPCYTTVSINGLGKMRMVIKDPEARKMIEELYRMEWAEIAHHFHVPTHQWTGPQSRSYDTFIARVYLYGIQKGLGGKVQLISEPFTSYDYFYVNHECPPELIPFFTELKAPREFVYQFATHPVPFIGTTYLTPRLSLGSVSVGDFWVQRRQIQAYWGTSSEPSLFRVRVLHDGIDFAAAQFGSVQKENTVLGGVCFAKDGGDTHLSFDRLKDGKFSASEVRVRFEFWTPAGTQPLTVPDGIGKTYAITVAGMPFKLNVPYAVFGDEKIRWEAGQDAKAKTSYIELVLYSGPKRDFKLGDLDKAAVAFALQLDGDLKAPLDVKSEVKDGLVNVKLGSLGLDFSAIPDTISALQLAIKTTK